MIKNFFAWVASVLGVLVVLFAVAWLVQGNDFFMYKYFAPKREQVRRQVFEQSKAYNQGQIQDLQQMMFEYVQAAPEQKAALASIILHRVADYDVNKLPPDLRDFVEKLRNDRLNGGQ